MVGGACGTLRRRGEIFRVLMRKSEEKRSLGRPSRRWEDGIEMNLREIA
jgi:hypothetical protein